MASGNVKEKSAEPGACRRRERQNKEKPAKMLELK
jgi:hypothetical protein